jgi:hypothetical protein
VNGQFDDEKHLVTHQEETISQLYPRVDVLYGSIGMPAQFQAHRLVGVIVVRFDRRVWFPCLDDVVQRLSLGLKLTHHVVDAASYTSFRRNPRRAVQSINQTYANRECPVVGTAPCCAKTNSEKGYTPPEP